MTATFGQPRRIAQHPVADGAALDRVAVEQARGGGRADEGELPGEVEGVLHAGVHALAAGGAVDVGGVAGEEDAAAGGSRRPCAR